MSVRGGDELVVDGSDREDVPEPTEQDERIPMWDARRFGGRPGLDAAERRFGGLAPDDDDDGDDEARWWSRRRIPRAKTHVFTGSVRSDDLSAEDFISNVEQLTRNVSVDTRFGLVKEWTALPARRLVENMVQQLAEPEDYDGTTKSELSVEWITFRDWFVTKFDGDSYHAKRRELKAFSWDSQEDVAFNLVRFESSVVELYRAAGKRQLPIEDFIIPRLLEVLPSKGMRKQLTEWYRKLMLDRWETDSTAEPDMRTFRMLCNRAKLLSASGFDESDRGVWFQVEKAEPEPAKTKVSPEEERWRATALTLQNTVSELKKQVEILAKSQTAATSQPEATASTPSNGGTRFGGTCFNCGKPGHRARKCPERERGDGYQDTRYNRGRPYGYRNASNSYQQRERSRSRTPPPPERRGWLNYLLGSR